MLQVSNISTLPGAGIRPLQVQQPLWLARSTPGFTPRGYMHLTWLVIACAICRNTALLSAFLFPAELAEPSKRLYKQGDSVTVYWRLQATQTRPWQRRRPMSSDCPFQR